MAYRTNELEQVSDVENIEQSGIQKLTRDLRNATATLTQNEVRYLVDYYYSIQNDRIRAKNRLRAFSEGREPHEVITWLSDNTGYLEKQIGKALLAYAESDPVGKWSLSIAGIGGVLASGLLAHIDISKAPSVGHIYSFGGIAPNAAKWEKGEKRPYNADLKTLFWKIGEAFVKVSNRESDYYGKVYKKSKEYLIKDNEAGAFAQEAAAILKAKNFGKTTEAYKYYSGQFDPKVNRILEKHGLKPMTKTQLTEWMVKPISVDDTETGELTESTKAAEFIKKYDGDGAAAFKEISEALSKFNGVSMLPPAHIHARAKRKAIYMFLSHWWEIAYRYQYPDKEVPKPYIIEHGGHTDYVPPPNNPFA